MKIYVDLDHVDITEYTQIESGEYNTNKINFIFTPEYKDLVKVAIFGCKLDTDEPKFYKIYLSDDSCYLPLEVTTTSDVISIGVYAFNVENGELKLRYSPTPVKTIVYEGSFREEAENSSSPTPTEIEQIMSRIISLEEITSDLNTRVEALENKACDLDSIKTRVDNLEDDVEGISGRLDTAESDIDELEGDIANTYSKTEVDTLLGSKVDTTTFNSSQAAQDEKIAKAELILSQLPKVTGEGTNISLSPTIEYDLEVKSYKGDTSQKTSILPSEYQQVEYIESSSSQYIDTGIKPIISNSVKPIIEIKGSTNNYNTAQRFFGIVDGDAKYFQFYNSSTARGIQLYNVDNLTTFNLDNNVHTYIVNISTGKAFDNGAETTLNYANGNTTYNLYLFGRNSNGTFNNGLTGKIYYFKYDDGTQKRDMIPCYRISDNVIGMYDLINNVFYTNSGSGTFTKGSNISIPNPNYPQDIQVVTGTQTVTVSNADNTESQTYTLHLGDIELAKIGTYQDKIYYDNGKWYKTTTIPETTLTSDMCSSVTASASYGALCYLNFNGKVDNSNICAMSNKFVGVSYDNRTSLPTGYRIFTSDGSGAVTIRFPNNSTIDTLQEVKDFVDNNVIKVKYVSQNASTTEITNETLLQDLNYIKENAMSYSGTTNISSSGDLPVIISASALKQLS